MGFQCKHKGFVGEYKFDFKSDQFKGQLINIPDNIFFSGNTPQEVHNAMKEAVEAYLEMRVEVREDLLKHQQQRTLWGKTL